MEPNPYQSPASGPQSSASDSFSSSKLGIKQVLFSFTGRIPRRTYWLWRIVGTVVFVVLVSLISPLLATQGDVGDNAPEISPMFAILLVVMVVPLIWIGLSLQVKRWHDRNKSGMWVLISMIPVIGPIWSFIECGCLRGTVGQNSYGPDPG